MLWKCGCLSITWVYIFGFVYSTSSQAVVIPVMISLQLLDSDRGTSSQACCCIYFSRTSDAFQSCQYHVPYVYPWGFTPVPCPHITVFLFTPHWWPSDPIHCAPLSRLSWIGSAWCPVLSLPHSQEFLSIFKWICSFRIGFTLESGPIIKSCPSYAAFFRSKNSMLNLPGIN